MTDDIDRALARMMRGVPNLDDPPETRPAPGQPRRDPRQEGPAQLVEVFSTGGPAHTVPARWREVRRVLPGQTVDDAEIVSAEVLCP